MPASVELGPEQEEQLHKEAETMGISVEDRVRHLLNERLAPASAAAKTLDLLRAWDIEDATDDPEELARRRDEWDLLRKSLEANQINLRPGQPDTP